MAINFDSLVIDRVIDAVGEDFSGNVRYLLGNLTNVSINTTSESKDKTDAQGVLIKRFFTAKTVELSGEVSVVSMSLIAEQSGSEKEVASDEKKLKATKFHFMEASAGKEVLKLKPLAPITKIYAINANGTLGEAYTVDTQAGEGKFSYDEESATITFPTNVTSGRLFCKYDYETTNGVKVVSKADKFPDTTQLTLRVVVADTCSVDTLRLAYIVFPSFQMSPDSELTLDTESTQSFSGSAQVDYCSASKDLYYIILTEDDEL